MTDIGLREFCKWYKSHFGKSKDVESVFLTCLCGHFHSYPKAMKEVLKRMQTLGLVTIKNSNISII
jgi:hypothetical protein